MLKNHKKNQTICLECLFYNKNKDKVRRYTNQFWKQSNDPFIQDEGSTMSTEK